MSSKIAMPATDTNKANALIKARLHALMDGEIKENSWLDGIIPTVKDCKIEISFVHKYFSLWFRDNKQRDFEHMLQKYCGSVNYSLAYEFSESFECTNTNVAFDSLSDAAEATFLNFIANEKNAIPVAAVLNIAEQPRSGNTMENGGKFSSPPLVLVCGKSGTGKTHILNAAFNKARAWDTAPRIFKCAAESFCCSYPSIAHISRLFAEKDTFFILDDIQQLAGEIPWQDILGACIDLVLAEQNSKRALRRMLLSFSGKPEDLKIFSTRLRIRLENGLMVELAEPDLEVRLRYLEYVSNSLHICLKKEHILWIARNFPLLPQIRGVLGKIELYARIHGLNPDIAQIEDILSGHAKAHPLGWQDILGATARRFGIRDQDIMGKCRKPDHVLARQMSMYLCRTTLGLSYAELGKLFGGKDHSTVMHAIKKVQHIRETDKDMHNLITKLEQEVQYSG